MPPGSGDIAPARGRTTEDARLSRAFVHGTALRGVIRTASRRGHRVPKMHDSAWRWRPRAYPPGDDRLPGLRRVGGRHRGDTRIASDTSGQRLPAVSAGFSRPGSGLRSSDGVVMPRRSRLQRPLQARVRVGLRGYRDRLSNPLSAGSCCRLSCHARTAPWKNVGNRHGRDWQPKPTVAAWEAASRGQSDDVAGLR